MSTAMTVYHEVLRAQLNKYKGVEMQIDGDAVLLGFRDPVSAIAWSLATQQVGMLTRQITMCRDICTLLPDKPCRKYMQGETCCLSLLPHKDGI